MSFLRTLLRTVVPATIRYCGIPLVVRNTVARRAATIVLYHDPSPESFEKHLAYMVERYHLIPLELLIESIESRDWSRIPPKSLVITFDDGHRGNYKLLHLFRKFNVRPTIYLASGIVGTQRHFWFNEAGNANQQHKHLPNHERLAALERDFGFEQTKEYDASTRQALSREEIAEMAEWTDFGSHTRFHPVLTACSQLECKEELATSRRELEEMLHAECRHLAYPNGDFSDREIRIARELGYRSGRTIDVGWNYPTTDPFRLRITGVTDDASVDFLAAQLSGLTMYLHYLAAGSLTGRHRTITPTTGTT